MNHAKKRAAQRWMKRAFFGCPPADQWRRIGRDEVKLLRPGDIVRRGYVMGFISVCHAPTSGGEPDEIYLDMPDEGYLPTAGARQCDCLSGHGAIWTLGPGDFVDWCPYGHGDHTLRQLAEDMLHAEILAPPEQYRLIASEALVLHSPSGSSSD